MTRMLRDYQVEASAAVDRELESVSSTLVVLPTGTGKTVVVSDIARRWSERGVVLFLAHRNELLEQAAKRFEPDLGYVPQIIQADREVNTRKIALGENVVIGSVPTLWREKRFDLVRRLRLPVGLVAYDEAHHCTSKSYVRVLEMCREVTPGCKALGVTATPRRTDKRALGLVFDSTAYKMDPCDAINLGWLVPPVEQRVVIHDVDFSHVSLSVNEFGEADFNPASLEAVMVEERPLQAVATPLIENAGGRKFIVFTAGVAHAHLLANILNRHKGGCALAVDGKNHRPGTPERDKAFRDFASGPVQFLCNFNIATEGVDVPECAGIANARPTKSRLVLMQMVGRCLRPLPGVVDGLGDAKNRRQAIASSAKREALVIYYTPETANAATATVTDCLGGSYKPEVVQIARQLQDDAPGKPVSEELRRAEILHAAIAQHEMRQRLKAKVDYELTPAGSGAPAAGEDQDIQRGGASDNQINFLVSLGVRYETASGYGKRQASVVIDRLKSERCTVKQKAILARFGQDTSVNFEAAKAVIDEIAANGWRGRKGAS